MANLYDYSLREVVTVPDSEVNQKVGQGSHSFLKGKTVHVLDPEGNIFNLPAEQGHLALEQGYSYAGAKDVEYEKLKQEISENPSTSFILGLLRSASFAYSDKLLTDAGVPPDVLKAHRDINPIANIGGEVAGVLTPFSPVGATAKLLTKATQGFVGKALARKGLEGTGRIVGGVAGGAVEGAVTTTPFAVSSMVLDESPELAAEQMIAGSSFGTVFGGIGGILAQSLNFSAKKGKNLADHLFYRSMGARTPEYNKLTNFGKNRDRMGEIGRRLRELDEQGAIKSMSDHENILDELQETLIPQAGQDLNTLLIQVRKAGKQRGLRDDLRSLRSFTDDLAISLRSKISRQFSDAAGNPIAYKDLPKAVKKIIDKVDTEIADITGLPKKIVRILGEDGPDSTRLTDAMKQKINDSKNFDFFSLETQKRLYQKLKDWSKAPKDNVSADQMDRVYGAMAQGLREESERVLTNIQGTLDNLNLPDKSLITHFRETKKLYGDLRDMEMLLNASVRRTSVNNTLSLTDIISGGSIGGGLIATSDSFLAGGLGGAAGFVGGALARRYLRDQGELLAARAVDSMADYGLALNKIGKTQQRIDQGVRALMKGGTVSAVKVLPEAEPLQSQEKTFKKIKKDLDEVMSNDSVIMARLKETVPAVEGNEDLQRSLMTTMMRQVNFLHSKLPKDPSADLQITYPKDDYVPGPTELAKFFRYNQIVNDPLKIIDHLRAGTLTPEHREALISVFPEFYKEVQEKLLGGLAEGKPDMTLPQKIQLSIYMGKPVDPTMTYLSDFQMSFMGQEEDKFKPKDRKIKGLKEQSQTDVERVS